MKRYGMEDSEQRQRNAQVGILASSGSRDQRLLVAEKAVTHDFSLKELAHDGRHNEQRR
jgi:hypothetical protein